LKTLSVFFFFFEKKARSEREPFPSNCHLSAPYIPFFRFRTDTSLSGLLPGKSHFGPCFLKKIPIFSDAQRHNPQNPDD